MVTLYWVCLFVGLYPYVVYPVLAALVAAVTDRGVRRGPYAPPVSVLISAYNEADCIEATVRNKLAQDYSGPVEVLVASDGCDDGTDQIVGRIAAGDPRVRFFRQERQGKTAALNRLVGEARGEIVVFSDANSMYRPDTVRRLVETFADESVGYVTGKMVYVNPDGSMVGDGCSAYMRYENRLREIETRLGSVVGVDGGVDAVRRALYRPMRADQLPDFVLPLAVVEQGARVVYAPEALLEEEALNEGASEFRMRVRVALRALWALKDNAALLAGRSGWLFAWQLWSHKVLRYLSFLPLGLAVVVSLGFVGAPASQAWVLAAELVVGVLTLVGMRGVPLPGARFAYYFVLLNFASLIASLKFVRGERQAIWRPRVG